MAVMMKKSTDKKWQDFRDRLENIKAAVDPRELVESLGFSVTRETSREIRGACAIHGGDNKTSFRFNKETRTWVCFSHQCHEVFGHDIIGLIKAAMSMDFLQAVSYLEKFVGDVDINLLDSRRKKEKEEFIRSRAKRSEAAAKNVNEKDLQLFIPFRSDYFLKKGYTKETLDFFEIAGGYTDSFKHVRDIIPIRDDEGTLMAYSLRDITDTESYDYKYIFTTGFNKDVVLYNLNNAKKYTDDKYLIVVEGQKSVWRLHQYGIKNVVASMGTYITTGQRSLIYKYALKGVVIMFDNDGPGYMGISKACEDLRGKLNDVVPIFITEVDVHGKGLDPSDLSKEEAYSYLSKYV